MLNLEELAQLLSRYPEAARAQVREFAVGRRRLRFNSQPAIMGVINLSPDSWYRESVCLSTEAACERGRILHAQGADVVDVGAESSLAHASRVDEVRQSSRLLPVIRALCAEGIAVSVETYEPTVVRAGLESGAAVLNLTGTTDLKEIFPVVAAHEAAVILCHVQGANVREVGDYDLGVDPIGRMYEQFARQIESATQAGVHKIFLDPGLGFYYRNLQDSAVRVRHQMQVFLNSFRLRTLGFPVCQALPHAFEFFREEVRCAEPFFAVLAALGKTDLFRTHEVARTRAVLRTMEVYKAEGRGPKAEGNPKS